jgi:hypothetical protein
VIVYRCDLIFSVFDLKGSVATKRDSINLLREIKATIDVNFKIKSSDSVTDL